MDIWRFARAGLVIGGLIGLALGVLYAFGGLVVDLLTTGLNRGTVLAFGALIGMPLIFATIGLAVGGLFGLVFRAVGSNGAGETD